MQLYRLEVTPERTTAASPDEALHFNGDDYDVTITATELAEPEATLHLNREEIARLTALVGLMPIPQVGANTYRELQRKLKIKLDGAIWQLAAQKTMLEKAQGGDRPPFGSDPSGFTRV